MRTLVHPALPLALAVALSLAVAAAVAHPGPVRPGPADGLLVRGVTISCQTWGREWGTDGFAQELDELAALGANWIAIHPYARVRADGEVSWRPLEPVPDWLARPLAAVRARGQLLMVKPHLAYWGSPFRWRGDVDFADPDERARFWRDYRRWIVELARATRGADAFVVGTELDRLLADEREWRELIAAVRAETGARLTYAANWSDVGRVPFWDALDAIGVQAYYPLCEDELPARAELERGWERVLGELRALHERSGKPVVFTELGYDRSRLAAAQPWGPPPAPPDDADAAAAQVLCLEVALAVIAREREWLRGAFLWKWFVGEAPGEDFVLDAPAMRAVLRAAWTGASGR